MEYRKKLKMRLYIAIGCILTGLTLCIVTYAVGGDNGFLSSFGLGLIVYGIVRVRNYLIITRSEERIRKQEIVETDEGNIAISGRARSAAFAIYTTLACIAAIVLEIVNESVIATFLALSVCVLIILYMASYKIISKRS